MGALGPEAAENATPTLDDLRGLGSRACCGGLDEVVLGVGVEVRGVGEGGGGPDGELGGGEAVAEVPTNIGAGRDVLG